MSTARRPRRDGPVHGIVPPHLLRRLADAEPAQRAAERTLAVGRDLAGRREVRAARARRPGAAGPGAAGPGSPEAGASRAGETGSAAGLLPPHLAQRLPDRSALAPRTAADGQSAPTDGQPAPHRSVHDAGGGTALPGTLVRAEGEEPTGDVSADEAYDGLGATWELFERAFDRDSLDGEGLGLVATVHYGQDFLNAFWDGQQMIFGDGDGIRFASFTGAVDVIGHELTHGVVQYTAGLIYVAQPGALHESIADCFGAMVKQRVLGQEAVDADWLIGEGIFTDAVQGEALRSMKGPGTAYDDPVLGKDPQPDSMAHYADLPHDEANDNGGVHINSGIPNRAFYLAATGIGGRSWEGAGPLWYDALTRGGLSKDADFATFAEATLAAAASRHGESSPQHEAVEQAWRTVGVLTAPTGRS
jgi:Zn-dependent metalloprotease